jgi:hypothetical protein
MVDPDNTKITNYSLLFPLIQKKGNSLEPFPFQLVCFISSDVCLFPWFAQLFGDGTNGEPEATVTAEGIDGPIVGVGF